MNLEFENKYCCFCRQTTRHHKNEKNETETCLKCGREKWLVGTNKTKNTSKRHVGGSGTYVELP